MPGGPSSVAAASAALSWGLAHGGPSGHGRAKPACLPATPQSPRPSVHLLESGLGFGCRPHPAQLPPAVVTSPVLRASLPRSPRASRMGCQLPDSAPSLGRAGGLSLLPSS